MNKIASNIERHFTGGTGGYWYIEKDQQKEAEMFRSAVDEINRLQDELDKARQLIDSDLADERRHLGDLIGQYEEIVYGVWTDIEKVRNAAKGMVTLIDKVREGGKTISPAL